MKKYLFVSIFIFLSFACAKAANIAIVAINSDSLNVRESAAKSTFQSYGQTVTVIDDSNADYNTLKNYDLSVATENGAISQTVINSLIENGEKVLLLYSSGQVMGGTWSSYYTSPYHNVRIESSSVFFDGFQSAYAFSIQSSEYANYISANYPSGWSIIGRNAQNSAYKTVLYKTHSSGGKGLIFTYSPESITSIGQNFYDLFFKWLTGIDAFSGKTVPTGNVAFIISGYDDDDSPTLSTREAALNAKLSEYGYNMTYIRSGRLQQSNLDNATLIVAVDYPSIDKYTIEDELNDGENVALYYSSAAVLGGDWDNYYTSNYHNLKIDANEIFLDGYKSDYSINIQNDYYAHHISASYPSGWTNIGRNIQNAAYKTMFYKTTSNGGKGLIFTYNPENISSQGMNVYDRIYKWFKGSAAFSGKTVPTNNVAFVIQGYDDDEDSPELTTREAALKAKLENYGYNLTFIRSARLPESNLTGAKMIVAVDYPSIDKYSIDVAIESGQNVWMHYSSASVLGGEWSEYYTSNYHSLAIGSNTEFLEGLKSNYGFYVQDDLYAKYVSSSYPSGWTVLGNNIQNIDYKTVLSKTHVSGGKGLIMTYNPENITNAGLNLYDKIYHWFEGTYKYSGKTIPSGNVAFIIQGYDDDSSPGLTTRESAMKSKLEAKGYNITFLKYSLLDNSDFSGASMIVAVEYPSLSKNKIENLLADGKNVALFWQSGSVLGGNWDSYNTSNYRTLFVESNTQYLSDYQIGDEVLVQSSDNACYITSNYPSDWTVLGRNKQNSTYKTVFSYNNVGKGLIYTYNPEFFSTDGNLVFDDIEEWLETENDDLGKPILYNPYHQSTEVVTSPKFTWNDVDDATSYQIQVATNATFSNIVEDENISNNDFDESSLNTSTKYYFRVRAKNTSQTGIWSEVSEFTTSSVANIGTCNDNLVKNPSCELPLVNGEIQYWDEVLGTSWTTGSDGTAHDGDYYFYAGANSFAELQQFVDISAYSNQIDSQSIHFSFEYWNRSFDQNPEDESKIILEFWNNNKSTKLDTFDFGYHNQLIWSKQLKLLTMPINTRWVKVRLVSKRNTGTNNDGYIDDITFKVSEEDVKLLSVKLYLDGLWDGTTHSPAPVSVELRSGTTLINSTLDMRMSGVIQSDGTVSLNFGKLPNGDYWVVVRSAGYMPLGSTSKISLSSTQASYNFTDAESKTAGGSRAVREVNSVYLMRSGDLNFDMKTNSTDALQFINNNGKSVTSYVPAP